MSDFMKMLVAQHNINPEAVFPSFFQPPAPLLAEDYPGLVDILQRNGIDPNGKTFEIVNPEYSTGKPMAIKVFQGTAEETTVAIATPAKIAFGADRPLPKLKGKSARVVIEDDIGFASTPRPADANPDRTEAWA